MSEDRMVILAAMLGSVFVGFAVLGAMTNHPLVASFSAVAGVFLLRVSFDD